MYIAVLSTSLNKESKSRRLARAIADEIRALSAEVKFVDLQDNPLPLCDGSEAYGHANVAAISEVLSGAGLIVFAAPIYNWDVSASAKNVIELCGSAFEGKTVAIACAAGGKSSFMAPMGLANSLMLDFRSHIMPKHLVAAEDAFLPEGGLDPSILKRVRELAESAVQTAKKG